MPPKPPLQRSRHGAESPQSLGEVLGIQQLCGSESMTCLSLLTPLLLILRQGSFHCVFAGFIAVGFGKDREGHGELREIGRTRERRIKAEKKR